MHDGSTSGPTSGATSDTEDTDPNAVGTSPDTPADAPPSASGPGDWFAARRGGGGHRTLWWSLGGVAVVVLFAAGLVAMRAGAALPGTHVDGLDVSGLGEADLRAAVDDLVAARQDAEVTVLADGDEFTFSPGEDGYDADVDAAVAAALAAGRDGVFGSFASHVTATFGGSRDIHLDATTSEDVVAAFVDDVAAAIDRPADPGSVRIDPETLELTTTMPATGRVLDRDGALAALTAVVGLADPDPVEFSTQISEPTTDPDDVADLARRAEAAIAEPLVLAANGGEASLDATEVATILRSEAVADTLVLTADDEALRTVLEPDLARLEVPAVDATFEPVSEIPVFDDQGDVTWTPQPAELRIIPSQPGEVIDWPVAADLVGNLLDDGQRRGDLPTTPQPADLTTADAEALGVTHLIGTFTTYHACCANRVTNIQRMADLVRGTVLRPGEEFSVNEHVGKRTIANGFVADGAIFNGEIRDEVGGGVSQFATTSYNAAFFAGIPILEHRAHSLYISRYPRGREATLNFPSIDLRIENDTAHGLFIHTQYTPTSITVSIFGDNGGREVSAVMGEPYSYRPFETRRRENPALPAGTEKVTQSGTQGYLVTVQRIIREGGDTRTEDIVTTYYPRPQIVEVGTGAPPPEPEPTPDPESGTEPEPEPEPDPEPEPEPTPDPTTNPDA